MALQKLFYIFKDPENESTHLVYVDDFHKYFKKEEDAANCIRRSYLVRSLKNVKLIEGKEAVPLLDILKYCFSHCERFKSCEKIVKTVENLALCGGENKLKTNEYVRSSFQLYSALAKACFTYVNEGLKHLQIDEASIVTLVAEHRNSFSDDEWKQIVLFEYHFSKENEEPVSYEELMQLKWSKFQKVKAASSVSQELENISKKHIKERFCRKETAKQVHELQINASKTHLAKTLDLQVFSMVQEYYPEAFGSVTVIGNDTVEISNQVSAIIEVKIDQDQEVYANICQSIKHDLEKTHCLQITHVMFLSSVVLNKFKNKEGFVSRFQFRDEWNLGSINEFIYIWEDQETFDSFDNQDQSLQATSEDNFCKSCISDSLPKPLSLKHFDIIHEWFTDIPLEIQLIIGAFLNRRQLQRSPDSNAYVKQKLERLYMAYDWLLNSLNKNYIGVFQQANTDELLQDCKSVKTIFNITSAAGATSSLTKAETDWKKRADDDLLYYSTYLKPLPLTYNTAAGLQTSNVSMRQCHVILMLDNLVKKKSGDNPARGEYESQHMCTIPITLQGLPKDDSMTEHWHDTATCDGSWNCKCKNRTKLNKDDIEKTLFKMSVTENSIYRQFISLYTWGHREIWRKMTGKLLFLYSISIHR